MEDLIKRLFSGEGKMNLLLLEAKEIVEKYDNQEFASFIDSELNGYTDRELPDYRKLKGKIVGDIQTPYGGIQTNVPIGISTLSEQIGMDVTVAHIFDGIGFIEENLEQLSSNTVNRQLPDDLVESLNHIVQYNNPGVTLLSAAHSFGKSGLQHIPSKVREELIKGLQELKKQTPISEPAPIKTEFKESPSKINVFVSYAWENEEHNDKIISFVDFLRKEGYNASMDRMKSQEETATNFNKMMITSLQEADKVIIVLSPKYKEKADSFQGGVGMEFSIIVEELKSNTNKYIFVSFGNNAHNEIVPTGIAGRDILDLKKDQDENQFNGLFAKLQSKNTLQFSDVVESVKEVQKKEIKPFKL